MYVCHCHAVTDREIKAAIAAGARDEDDVERATGAMATCGSCEPTVCAILRAAGFRLRSPERIAV